MDIRFLTIVLAYIVLSIDAIYLTGNSHQFIAVFYHFGYLDKRSLPLYVKLLLEPLTILKKDCEDILLPVPVVGRSSLDDAVQCVQFTGFLRHAYHGVEITAWFIIDAPILSASYLAKVAVHIHRFTLRYIMLLAYELILVGVNAFHQVAECLHVLNGAYIFFYFHKLFFFIFLLFCLY